MTRGAIKHEGEGHITILFDSDRGLEIEICDSASSTARVTATLTPEQVVKALSRVAHTPCAISWSGLDVVGKKMEIKKYEFELEDQSRGDQVENALSQIGRMTLPDGWVPDNYMGSQDSFFQRDGKTWGRVTIRRWV